MNKCRTRVTILLILLLAAAGSGAGLFAQEAQSLIDRADDLFSSDRVYSRSRMVVYNGETARPPQEMEGFVLDKNGTISSLTLYSSPARMRGTAYLMIGDDLWVRFGSTGRIRKLSSSAKKNAAGGSDFSYSDMGEGGGGIADKYTARLLGEEVLDGTACWHLVLEPQAGRDVPYQKLEVWIAQGSYRYQQVAYYEDGAHIKTMTMEDWREVPGGAYPFRVIMRSHVGDSRTEIETLELEMNSAKVRDRYFSASYLRSLR